METSSVDSGIRAELEHLAEGFRDLRAFMNGAGIDQETAEELLQGVYRESLREGEECYKDSEMFAESATRGFTKAILF